MGVLQALVSDNGRLYAMWKGVPGDDRIFWAFWTGSGVIWSAQGPMGGRTSVGPSMTVFNGQVYAAWKGQLGDPRIFFASLNGVTWSAQGIIPWAYSDEGPALGAIGNKLVAVWKNAWDQTLWYAEYDGNAWGAAALIAGVESSVGVSLALYNGKLYAALRGVSGNENLFYISFDGSKWSGQGSMGGKSLVGPSLAGVGPYLYAVWRGADTDQALRWSFFNGTSWAPAGLISGGNSSEGAAISVFNGVLYALWKGVAGDNTLWMSHLNGSAWAPVYQPGLGSTGQDPVGIVNPAPPPSVLGSSSNYFFASNCQKLASLLVLIGFSQDLVAAPPPPGGEIGCAFQLNCNSSIDAAYPQNPNWIVWQQYIVGMVGTVMRGAVNNWNTASLQSNQEQTINAPAKQFATLARANTIPAGSTLSIQLSFDGAWNVTGVTFNLSPGGTPTTIPLLGLALTGGGKVTTANLAPIAAFELNLVGAGDRMHTHFTSGAGTIVYLATQPLTPLASLPDCVANQATTGETSNSVYGELPANASYVFAQAFQVNPGVQ